MGYKGHGAEGHSLTPGPCPFEAGFIAPLLTDLCHFLTRKRSLEEQGMESGNAARLQGRETMLHNGFQGTLP